jgi:hypothetical protein
LSGGSTVGGAEGATAQENIFAMFAAVLARSARRLTPNSVNLARDEYDRAVALMSAGFADRQSLLPAQSHQPRINAN